MATYYSIYPITDWNGQTAWWDPTDNKFGTPGSGDLALIQDNTPVFSSGYLDGPTVWLDNIYGMKDGLTVTNSVVGGDTNIFANGGTASDLTLNNSLIYGDIFSQQGGINIAVGSGDYGALFGTMVVGGFPQTASVGINAYTGTWSNIGAMDAFANGQIYVDDAGTMSNYGAMAANVGSITVLDVGQGPGPGVFDNEGGLYAANGGELVIEKNLTQNGSVNVDGGVFVLDDNSTGSGMYNLNGGVMRFQPEDMSMHEQINAAFTGSAFELDINGADNLSYSLNQNDLHIAGTYGGLQTPVSLDVQLPTGQLYDAQEFSIKGDALLFNGEFRPLGP